MSCRSVQIQNDPSTRRRLFQIRKEAKEFIELDILFVLHLNMRQLNIYMQNWKLCFIFESFSFPMSPILINNLVNSKRITDNSEKRMSKKLTIFSRFSWPASWMAKSSWTSVDRHQYVDLMHCSLIFFSFSKNFDLNSLTEQIYKSVYGVPYKKFRSRKSSRSWIKINVLCD